MAETLLTPEAASLDVGPVLAKFEAEGHAPLGQILSPGALEVLRQASDDLLLGRVQIPGFFFQLDSPTGRYDDLRFNTGWVGPRLDYRKVEKLELEPRFLALIENALFERIVRAWIPGDIAIYRAVLWNKSPQGGTELPWHQDGGKFWGLDRDPTLQIWTALDDATEEAGCLELVPGSHRGGLVTPYGGQIAEDELVRRDAAGRAISVPVRAGEALLLHNHTWHRSGLNRSSRPRRAVSISFMDAATRCTRRKRAPRTFVRVFNHGRS